MLSYSARRSAGHSGRRLSSSLSYRPISCHPDCCCWMGASHPLGRRPQYWAAWEDDHPSFARTHLPICSSLSPRPPIFVLSRTSSFHSSSCFYQARMGGRVRDAPAFNRARTMPEMPSRSNLAVRFNNSTITTRLGAPSHRFAPVRTVSCNTPARRLASKKVTSTAAKALHG